MKQNHFLTFYEVKKLSYQNIFSAGPDLFFEKPCIGYIKKGSCKFLYHGNTFYAKEGDLIYIAYETRYQSIWYGTPEIEWYSINFEFDSKYAFYDYRFQILNNYPKDLLENMYATCQTAPMQSIAYFYLLLDDLYTKLQPSPTNPNYPDIDAAVGYLENHYNEKIPIKTLAEISHSSESGFFKRFKKSTGVTPIEFKHNIMIQVAIELLTNTSLSIEEISDKIGFSSSNHFRKIFFRLTEKTPKEFRKNK